MKAVGVTSGIGSMLIGARSAGFDIVANLEWRPYYLYGTEYVKNSGDENTFEMNFPRAVLTNNYDVDGFGEIHLAMGHTECGNFSNLKTDCNAGDDKSCADPADILLWIETIQRLDPHYFVQDNLPKSLIAVNIRHYAESFPDHYLFPEWVSNFNYGNPQKNRRRFFLIGGRKDREYVFIPGEEENNECNTVARAIRGLPPKRNIREINHIHYKPRDILPGWGGHHFRLDTPGNKLTVEEFQDQIRDYPSRRLLPYYNKRGESKLRPGYFKVDLTRPAPVLTGGGSSAFDNHFRSDTLLPFTMRERARIQGCRDDFIYYPLDYMYNKKAYIAIYKQLGKFMPVQFCRYVSQQIANHEHDFEAPTLGQRLVNTNPYVDEAKRTLCLDLHYGPLDGKFQKRVCEACWMTGNCGVF